MSVPSLTAAPPGALAALGTSPMAAPGPVPAGITRDGVLSALRDIVDTVELLSEENPAGLDAFMAQVPGIIEPVLPALPAIMGQLNLSARA